jgi:pilus assembly protein CpaE
VKGKASSSQRSSLCVLTICADSETVDRVMRATLQVFAAQFVGELSSYLTRNGNLEILQRAQASDACVCVIDFDRDRVQAVQSANALAQMFGARITLVALSEKADSDLILDAMRSGCSEYLVKPLQAEQLCESLVRLQGRWAATQSAVAARGRLLVFLGTRGGAGTTTLAVHLATFLAQAFGKKTLLIDHHEQLGHVGLYLGLEPTRYDFCELVRNVDRLDAALVNGFLAHHGSGTDVIVSADMFDTLPDVPLDHAESTLQFLRGLYDYILLDCDRGFGTANLGLIDQADEIYLIATPDVPALRDLSRCVDRLMQSSISPGKLKVAINRHSSAGAVTLQQIEKAIRQPISITIPNSANDLIRAMNTGTPLTPESKSDFAIQMGKWAASLVPGAAELKTEAEPKRRFAFWS